jgi:hypothetical protein
MLAMPRIEPGGEMPTDASSKVPLCHACHAHLRTGDETCWLCGAAVTPDVNAAAAKSPSAAAYSTKGSPGARFSLATLMMFMTLVAVVCGLISIAPGIGIALAVILLPVLAHTGISVRSEQAKGHSLRPGDQVGLFFGSLSLIVVAGVAASIAFGVTCFGGFFAGAAAGEALGARGYDPIGWGAVAGIGLGAIAAAFVGYRAMVGLSRYRGNQALSRRSKLILAATFVVAAFGAVVAIMLFGVDGW